MALVGRVIFAFSWAVVNTMFPVMAGTRSQERKDHRVLSTSLLLVFSIGSILALVLRVAPAEIWSSLFGSQFVMAGKYGLPYLLALYAATTVIYSLSVVIIAYEMSYKIANTGWVQLAFSGVLIAGIYRFHSSLQQVIWVQLAMMVVLLIVVVVPFVLSVLRGEEDEEPVALGNLRAIRRVSENEVIAEFLKNDFASPEFEAYREAVREIVATPDLSDPSENATRRALFFLRHGPLWREIPKGTEWFEAEVPCRRPAPDSCFSPRALAEAGAGQFCHHGSDPVFYDRTLLRSRGGGIPLEDIRVADLAEPKYRGRGCAPHRPQ